MTQEQTVAQLRHAYKQLKDGTVVDQPRFADGLIAPVIRALEATPSRVEAGELLDEALAALRELIASIDKRWNGETARKRENAISPRMEEAIDVGREVLAKASGAQS